jgi:hypothetical protein
MPGCTNRGAVVLELIVDHAATLNHEPPDPSSAKVVQHLAEVDLLPQPGNLGASPGWSC